MIYTNTINCFMIGHGWVCGVYAPRFQTTTEMYHWLNVNGIVPDDRSLNKLQTEHVLPH